MREVHFFDSLYGRDKWIVLQMIDGKPSPYGATDYVSMDKLQKNIPDGDVVIVTTQMCFLSTQWFQNGFKIFVHDKTGEFEIVLGGGNERTDRYIWPYNNLFRMWENGEFGLLEVEE